MQSNLQQSLIKKTTNDYNPFNSPPDLKLAQQHQLAMAVGTDPIGNFQSKRCPCCHHQIDKNPLELCSPEQQLSFLGVGYPLYFRLTKYYAWLIIIVFIVSGSAYYFLVTMNCNNDCLKFFGIPIINLNHNPDQSTRKTQWFNFATCILIMIGVLYFKPKIKNDIQQFKTRFWCPSSYTIMLQNLPLNINKDQINTWITKLVDESPIKINMAYDIDQYRNAYNKKQQLIIEFNKIRIEKQHESKSTNKIQVIQKLTGKLNKIQIQIQQHNNIIKKFNTADNPPAFTGTAFITFSEKWKINQILQKYGDSFFKGFINCLFGYVKSPYPLFNKKYILISRAPSPNDVIWQNLKFSFIRNIFFEIIAVICMGILILLAFKLQNYMIYYAFELKQEGLQSGHILILFQAASMSTIVVILNYFLRIIIEQFSKIQKYYSYTKFNEAFCNNYFLLYSLNTCFTVYIVHGSWTENNANLLLSDIHLIMLTNAFTQPLFKLFNPLMWFRYLQRARIRYMKQIPYTQHYVNSLWEGYPICNADNYQYINRILYVTVWFAYPAPLGVIFSLFALLLNYWIDKIFLLRVNRFPQTINQTITSKLLMGLQILPIIYICGTLQYCYQVGNSSNLIQFVSRFLSYGIVFLVMIISLIGYIFFFRRDFDQIRPEITYKEAQYLFPYDYDIQNPITRYHSQIDFLKKILQNNLLGEERNSQIQNLILSHKGSKQQYQLPTSQIAQIKKMLANSRRHQIGHSSIVEMSNIIP